MKFILHTAALLLLTMPMAFAQSSESLTPVHPREFRQWENSLERRTKEYNDLTTQLMEILENDGDRRQYTLQLRWLYPNTSFYAPEPTYIIEEMTELAYVADTSEDPVTANKALSDYRTILRRHIINAAVLDFAITMAQANTRYGDYEALSAIRADIIAELLKNNGLSSSSAYQIITYQEEAYAIAHSSGKLKKTENFHVSSRFYNVHDILMPSGRLVQIFTDVTEPTKKGFMMQERVKRDKVYTIHGAQ